MVRRWYATLIGRMRIEGAVEASELLREFDLVAPHSDGIGCDVFLISLLGLPMRELFHKFVEGER
jgi:hypothetical protein